MAIKPAPTIEGAVEFGKVLIESGDLDPVYVMLRDADLPRPLLKRFLLAYSWFYHVGVAAWLCDQQDMLKGALFELQTLPRGSERRHFRAENALKCLRWFAAWRLHDTQDEALPLESILDYWFIPGANHFKDVYQRIRETPQYGPWIAFKLIDLGVNVLGERVNAPEPEFLQMYSEPTKSAQMLAEPGDTVGDVVRRLNNRLKAEGLRKPWAKKQDITVLEVETVLCKYKSHINGHYPYGKDTKEIQEALEWRPSPVAEHLLESCSLWS